MAAGYGVSPRSLRNWKRADPAERGPGRPALSAEQLEEARDAVLGELERQGWSAGEEPIWRGLGCRLPRSRVRRVLAELKAERRARHAEHVRAARVSVRVEARDVVWSLDATHLGRDERGAAVQAEVLREVASTTTIALSVGPAAKGHEIVGLLGARRRRPRWRAAGAAHRQRRGLLQRGRGELVRGAWRAAAFQPAPDAAAQRRVGARNG